MNKTILTILIFILFLTVPLKAGILTDDPAASQERYSMEITGAADSYKISLNLPRTSFVRLILTSEKGKTVRKLINENIRAGKYDLMLDTKDLGKGKYKLSFHANDHSESRELTVLSFR